jgi:hypothetical protein
VEVLLDPAHINMLAGVGARDRNETQLVLQKKDNKSASKSFTVKPAQFMRRLCCFLTAIHARRSHYHLNRG